MQELQGRVAGRNNDDARFLCKGLAVLHKEWEALEAKASRAEHLAQVDFWVHLPCCLTLLLSAEPHYKKDQEVDHPMVKVIGDELRGLVGHRR